MPTVAVLGCGPAGLFAAQAVCLAGATPVIISQKKKSVIYGAQYLHEPIPGITDWQVPDGYIETILMGEEPNYAERIYGDPERPTSWRRASPEPKPAWSLQRAYDTAWRRFESGIVNMQLGYEEIETIAAQMDLVISTIPRWATCKVGHTFETRPILVKSELEYTGLPEYISKQRNVVIYNGTKFGYWYRTSLIFGEESTEAAADHRLQPRIAAEKQKWSAGFKIVGNDCDCLPNIVRAGRMGLWESGVLTHEAFSAATEAMFETFGTQAAGEVG